MVVALEIAWSIEHFMSFDVYQRTFEMRISQAACLNRLVSFIVSCLFKSLLHYILQKLYEKVYNIAENLVSENDQRYKEETLLVPSMR